MTRLLGNSAGKVTMSSTKSATGHLLGAAGAIEAIFCGAGDPRPGGAADDQPREPLGRDADRPRAAEGGESATIDVVLSNSFGFGGTNASLVLRRVA